MCQQYFGMLHSCTFCRVSECGILAATNSINMDMCTTLVGMT